jgi:hypothetical protein
MTMNVYQTVINSAHYTPACAGVYMLLRYEWVGGTAQKPIDPSWQVTLWDGASWQKKRYTFDTGGLENFEAVAWCELPPVHSY